MEKVIEVLKSMGAKNIEWLDDPLGKKDSSLAFEFDDKRVEIRGCWFNTGFAGIDGDVELIRKAL